ncbi:MAG TPA: ribosome maturation factor RimP [Acidimicrobiales bacterium]|nr:ribosome maturation factor RimP [Acidimicrobiales bacterium]
MGPSDGVRSLVEPALAAAGLEIWDVEFARGALRLLVDSPDGVDLDALTRASGIVSGLLDDHPEVTPEGSYELEVSSPGVERTLRTPDHYRRYLGAEVSVKTNAVVGGARRHRGRLAGVADDGIELQPAEPPAAEPVAIAFDDIERTRTVLVWGPTPAPGARRRGRNASSKPSAAPAALDAKDAS